MKKSDVAAMRKNYGIDGLDVGSVYKNPIAQFENWFERACENEGMEANAMTLSTIGLEGNPQGRVVLLKSYDANGFTFFTNYKSVKGKELKKNPAASLTFYWKSLEGQVRIDGKVERVSEIESNEYFASRPRESQIGAWASPQSDVIPDRAYLEAREKEYAHKFSDTEKIPRPPHWGGYLVIPQRIEFWQGRSGRLHDRLVYSKENDNWVINRLAP